MLLDLQDVRDLIADSGRGRVSVYLPTHVAGPGTLQDPIRLSNLLDKAEKALAADFGRGAASRIIKPGRRLLRDENFWLHQSRGLSLFLSGDSEMRTYRMPLPVKEMVLVSDRFHVKPLLPLLSGDGRFYVLAVSQARVRLFVASRDSIRELDLQDVPDSLRGAVGYDWEQKSLQFHSTGTRAGGAGGGTMFHGHGAGADDSKKEIQRFFRMVDAGVRGIIGYNRGPVVLAMVDYLRPIYRLVSKLPNIHADGIGGNPDHRPAQELHELAWNLVEPGFKAGRKEAENVFQEMSAIQPDRTSTDLNVILPAVFNGRVETLFVAEDVEAWGRYDPKTCVILGHDQRRPDDCDLLDVAAGETLTRHGGIYAVHHTELPGEGQIAALFRY